jgi:hypothetical protein
MAREAARKNRRLKSKIAELFEYRHLFVKHLLTLKDKKIRLPDLGALSIDGLLKVFT